MSSSNNNNTSNIINDRRAQHQLRVAESQDRLSLASVLDSNRKLQAEMTTVKNQITGLTSVIDAIQQQQHTTATPIVANGQQQPVSSSVTQGDASARVTAAIHSCVASFPECDRWNFENSFRHRDNQIVTTAVLGFVASNPRTSGLLSDMDVRNRVRAYFNTLRTKSRTTEATAARRGVEIRRYSRVYKKLKTRIATRQRHAEDLESRFPGCERLLRRECMSPEMSDDEEGGRGRVLRRLVPAFRSSTANEFFDDLDAKSKADAATGTRRPNGEYTRLLIPGSDVQIEQDVLNTLPDWAK